MIKIVYFGSTELSGYILEKLIEFGDSTQKYTVQAVVTQSDKPVGRKKQLEGTPVSMVAEKHDIPLLKPERLNQEFIESNKAQFEADLYILVAYGKIIPQSLLDIPKLGTLNVHPSLLPKYRGPSPIKSVILNGEEVTGISIILLDAEMDHGPILKQTEVPISISETDETLSQKLAIEGANVLLGVIPDFVEGKIQPQSQDHAAATYTKMFTKTDGFFEIDTPPPAEQLDRMIRAFHPWPNVWTRWNNKVVKFYPDAKIQIEGKKIVSMAEFKRGYPDFPL